MYNLDKTTNKPYTEADDAVIRARALDGWSGSQIATELGRTRNSVIGRAHRMNPKVSLKGLNRLNNVRGSTGGHGRPCKMPVTVSRASPRPVKVHTFAAPDLHEDELDAVHSPPFVCDEVSGPTLIELRSHQCRWEVSGSWVTDQYRFCGRLRLKDVSYCAEHAKASTRSWSQAQQEFAEHKAQHMRDGKQKRSRWGKAV